MSEVIADANPFDEKVILDSMPQPVLAVGNDRRVRYANLSAQEFFGRSLASLQKKHIADMLPFGSPLVSLIEKCLDFGQHFNEYGLDLSGPHAGNDRMADIHVASVDLPPHDALALVIVQPRSIAHHIDRQLTHRGAARSVSAMSAMLAHEIKNPLSGIKGAAQLLEVDADSDNQALTRLICDETDRIAGLVGQFEQFSNTPTDMDNPVNIHAVLDNVRLLAVNGFAAHVRIIENYDPSLPPVLGNRDMLTQVFLNLVKNAAEAVDNSKGEIRLYSAFRPGVRLSVPGRARPVSLPLEFGVIDNGIGVPEDIKRHLFDPFVTTKSTGTGLGLAMVAKIVGDHGGTIECDSVPGRTLFCVRLPMAGADIGEGEAL